MSTGLRFWLALVSLPTASPFVSAAPEVKGRTAVDTRGRLPGASAGCGSLLRSEVRGAAPQTLSAPGPLHPQVSWSGRDGEVVAAGRVFGTVTGPAASILVAERVALNFMQVGDAGG